MKSSLSSWLDYSANKSQNTGPNPRTKQPKPRTNNPNNRNRAEQTVQQPAGSSYGWERAAVGQNGLNSRLLTLALYIILRHEAVDKVVRIALRQSLSEHDLGVQPELAAEVPDVALLHLGPAVVSPRPCRCLGLVEDKA